MSRISRKCLDTIYYHVMTQGINKENIFEKKYMKTKYIRLFFEKSKINGISIIAYCIMDNHAHILVKSMESTKLSKMMSQVNSAYGKFYNSKKDRTGYVFRDRYRAEPIINNSHLKNCIKYIHENPVKAKIVSKCGDYEFSSYNSFITNSVDSRIIFDVYGDDKDYLDKISGEYEECNFIDAFNEFGEIFKEDFEQICEEYKGINFKNEENVFKVSRELKIRSRANDNMIMDFMGIKRATYYNILKRQRNLDF